MKPAAAHRLKKLTLSVSASGCADHAEGQALQQRLSAYCTKQLERALQPCFDQAAGDSRIYQIRRIELDLGRIDPLHLESQLEQRIQQALGDHLRRLGLPRPQPAAQAPGADFTSAILEPSLWQVLLDWLERGVLEAEREPPFLMQQAILEAPTRLASTLRRISRPAELSNRLARALPESTLEQLVGVLTPGEADYLVGYVHEIRHAQHKYPLVDTVSEDFGASLWAIVLNYLVDSRGSEFNRRAFVSQTLQQLARRYRIDFSELLAQLTHNIESRLTRVGRHSGLLSLLHGLRQTAHKELGSEPVLQQQAAPNQESFTVIEPAQHRLAALAAVLQGRADSYSGRALAGLEQSLPLLIRQQPAALRALLHTTLRSADARRRLLRGLPANLWRQLWRLLAAGQAQAGAALLRELKQALRFHAAQGGAMLELHLADAALAYWAHTTEPTFDSAKFVAGVARHYAQARAQSYRTLILQTRAGLSSSTPALALALRSLSQSVSASVAGSDELETLTEAQTPRFTVEYHEVSATQSPSAMRQAFFPEPIPAELLNAFIHWRERGFFTNPADLGAATSLAPPSPTALRRLLLEIPASPTQLDERSTIARSRPVLPKYGSLIKLRQVRRPLNLARPVWFEADTRPSSDAAELTSLKHWLITGSLPWWAADGAGPQRSVQRLLRRDPQALLKQLRGAILKPGVLPRLLQFLPDAILRQLVLALNPGQGGFILTWLSAGAAMRHRDELSGSQRRHSVATHWEVALGLLLRPQEETFSVARFLDDAARRVSQKLAWQTDRYRQVLLDVALQGSRHQARYAILAEMLGDATLTHKQEHLHAALPASPKRYVARTDRRGLPKPQALARNAAASAMHDQTLWLALEKMLRYGRTLNPIQLAKLNALSRALAQSPAGRRRIWRARLNSAINQGLSRQRLASLLPLSLLQRLLPLWLTAAQIAALGRVLAQLVATLAAQTASQRLRIERQAWDVLLEQLYLQRSQRWSLSQLLLAWAQRFDEHGLLTPLHLFAALKSTAAGQPRDLRDALDQACRVAALDPVAQTTAEPVNRPALKLGHTLARNPVPKPSPHRAEPQAETPSEGEALYVDNAGMVVLYPFIGSYFERLGLVVDGRFIGEPARSRAVYLLQYLVCGEHSAPEHELALNKLLCGMPLSASPEFVAAPSNEEKRIGDDMLYAVTQRWQKLSNTSIDALRETFLRRGGRLLCSAEKNTLTVSQKAYDMLLDSLPWSFSMIKLPWMSGILFVKWR